MEGGREWREREGEGREGIEGGSGGKEVMEGEGEERHAVSTLSTFPAVNPMWHVLVMTKQQCWLPKY